MSEVKRYMLFVDKFLPAPIAKQSEDGVMVFYDDHEAALAQARVDERGRCKEAVRAVADHYFSSHPWLDDVLRALDERK